MVIVKGELRVVANVVVNPTAGRADSTPGTSACNVEEGASPCVAKEGPGDGEKLKSHGGYKKKVKTLGREKTSMISSVVTTPHERGKNKVGGGSQKDIVHEVRVLLLFCD
ncbi:unnamed protein product [Penicillium bialowiezense]